jgi:excisionase family DNA binding protein
MTRRFDDTNRDEALRNLLRPTGRSSRKQPAAAGRVEHPLVLEPFPDKLPEPSEAFAPLRIEVEPLCVRLNVAAKMIGVGKTKLYELIADGEVEVVKMGKTTCVTVSSLQALVRRRVRAGR